MVVHFMWGEKTKFG